MLPGSGFSYFKHLASDNESRGGVTATRTAAFQELWGASGGGSRSSGNLDVKFELIFHFSNILFRFVELPLRKLLKQFW